MGNHVQCCTGSGGCTVNRSSEFEGASVSVPILLGVDHDHPRKLKACKRDALATNKIPEDKDAQTCPSGHNLKRYVTDGEAHYKCNVCDNELLEEVEMGGCRECDWDLCHACYRSKATQKGYDYAKPTEDNYGIPHFRGRNADIRPLLDYTYHRKYSPEREELQDKIIDRLCSKNLRTCSLISVRDQDQVPWVLFTAGAMGAGKGYAIGWMDEQQYLPLSSFAVIDPDQVRQLLPEWSDYVQRDPNTAGDMTQKEAGLIAEIAGYRALRSRKNVIFDGSLRDTKWYIEYLGGLREKFPGIRIMILHVVARKEEILKRAEERGKESGRYVPRDTLLASIDAVPKSIQELAPYADFVCRVRNSDGLEPQLEREPGAPNPPASVELTWELVQSLWRSLDINEDGELSETEIERAIIEGILTEKVVKSLDVDGDRRISKAEFERAKAIAMSSGMKQLK